MKDNFNHRKWFKNQYLEEADIKEEMSFDYERDQVKKVIRQAIEDMDSNQTLLTRDYIDTIISRLNDLKMSDF
tara:strand:+ start:611 stop:829 length:219 start_codon:yes stop_codon:yes gene_type:complete